MTEKRSVFRVLIASLLIALMILPNTLYAQGFEFGEDEGTEEDGGEGMEFGDDEEDSGEEMSFDSDDLSKEDVVAAEDAPTVAIIAVPGPAMDPERQRAVQGAMSAFAQTVPGIKATGPETALPSLIDREGERCVAEPICLGAVGDEAKVDRMVLARVVDENGTLKLVVDYFEVGERLFIRSNTQSDVSGTSGAVEAVEPAMKSVLAIRDKSGKQDFTGKEDAGIVQDVIAWGAAGLAVGALVGGIVFGLQASSKEDEVGATKNADGTYSITQAQAENLFSEASDKATTANIFYGLAAALTVTSVVFFIIRGGSDVSSDQDRVDLIQDFRIAPIVTEAGAGIGAGFRF